MDKKIGIVILNYNTYYDTIECIDSIIKHEPKSMNYHFCIVDNASFDGSGNDLLNKYNDSPNINIILNKKNLGFSGGNNVGIKELLSEGVDYIFLFNSDVMLQNDAITRMSSLLESNGDVVCVGPIIKNLDGIDLQRAYKPLTFKSFIFSKKPIKTILSKLNKELYYFETSMEKDYFFSGCVQGCCFGFKGSFLISNNFLDDKIFLYYEENVLAQQISQSGHKACIKTGAIVIHKEEVSTKKTSTNRSQFSKIYGWNSSLYILWKYAGVNKVVCDSIYYVYVIIWSILSIVNKKYRETFSQFRAEHKRIMSV